MASSRCHCQIPQQGLVDETTECDPNLLPNEILTRIFTIHAAESSLSSWTKVMFVCRLWHEIVVSSQHLWSTIEIYFCAYLPLLLVQLRLSGAAPLTISINYWSSLAYAGPVMDHAARIISLELTENAPHLQNIAALLTDFEFPLIESLSLYSIRRDGEPESTQPPVLAPEIVSTRMPRLKSLTLQEINLPWASLSGLEHLDLTEAFDSTTSNGPSIGALLPMLAFSPKRKTLSLDLIVPPATPEHCYPTIRLPLLEYMLIRAHAAECTALLGRLIIPTHTRICLYPLGINSGDSIRDLLVPVRKHIRAKGSPAPTVFRFHCSASISGTTQA
ncbi:hypothetical protein C8J57DRAFT_1718549 [Mycena rebaudengoi]|nr:hypothetical protein C8J57DRAFT_1718549 [Mycena rebaudengoi]